MRVTLDLHGVTFCDCAGTRALRNARQLATGAGIDVRVAGLTPPVRRMLAPAGAADLLAAEPAGPDQADAPQPHGDGVAALTGIPGAGRGRDAGTGTDAVSRCRRLRRPGPSQPPAGS